MGNWKLKKNWYLSNFNWCIALLYLVFEFEKQDLSKYEYWIVDTEITDYEFIENGGEWSQLIGIVTRKSINKIDVLDKSLGFGSPGANSWRAFHCFICGAIQSKKSAWNEVLRWFSYPRTKLSRLKRIWKINVYDTKVKKLDKKVFECIWDN